MRFRTFRLGIALAAAMLPVNAQWLNYPEKGTPLTRDGKPDLSAKAPQAANGKPDLSGVWKIEPPAAGEIERMLGNLGANLVEGCDPRTFSPILLPTFSPTSSREKSRFGPRLLRH